MASRIYFGNPTAAPVATKRRYSLTVLGVGMIPIRWMLSVLAMVR